MLSIQRLAYPAKRAHPVYIAHQVKSISETENAKTARAEPFPILIHTRVALNALLVTLLTYLVTDVRFVLKTNIRIKGHAAAHHADLELK